jgi:hypothetical protein
MVNPRASRAAIVVTGAGAAEAEQPSTVVTGIVPVIVGGVLSIRVLYVICELFPQASVADTVITAPQVPDAEVENVTAAEQLSVAVVAVNAAASASALVG